MKQKLTDTAVKALRSEAAAYRVSDGGGLCLEITPKGEKLWRYRVRIGGKASMMSHGRYPETTREAHGASGTNSADRRDLKTGALGIIAM